MNRSPRCGLIVFAVLISAANLAARPLRIAYAHWFPCVPLGIAEHNKYWRDAGLQVELRAYATSQESVAALKDGEVDLAYDMIATWIDVAVNGAPIAIVGETDWSHGGDKLLLRKGATLPAMKGKPIAVYLRGSALMLFLREGLAREGLSVPDFPIVEVPEQEKSLQLFHDGKLHAFVSNEPWASRIEQAGATVVATTADFPGVSPEGFAVRPLNVDDATLKKFFAVWFRAVDFLHQPANHAAVAEIASIYAFAGTEAITPADVANYAKTTPVHAAAAALRHNDLEKGNARQIIQRFSVLRRLQGKPMPEADLARYFYLEPMREVAAKAIAAPTAVTALTTK